MVSSSASRSTSTHRRRRCCGADERQQSSSRSEQHLARRAPFGHLVESGGGLLEIVHGRDVRNDAAAGEQVDQFGLVAPCQLWLDPGEGADLETLDHASLEQYEVERY